MEATNYVLVAFKREGLKISNNPLVQLFSNAADIEKRMQYLRGSQYCKFYVTARKQTIQQGETSLGVTQAV